MTKNIDQQIENSEKYIEKMEKLLEEKQHLYLLSQINELHLVQILEF